MANKEFVLCSAPHGGRYARYSENGSPLNEIEANAKIPLKKSLYSATMPVTVEETIAQIKTLYDMGVRFFHDHSYDKNGIHACNPKFYRDLEIEIRKIDPQILHSIASSNRRGGQILMIESIFAQFAKMGIDNINKIDLQKPEHFNVFVKANMTRFRGTEIPVRPDTITTLTNFEYGVLSKNISERTLDRMVAGSHPDLIKSYYRAHKAQIQQRGVHEEIEISTMVAFDAIEKHFSDKNDPFKTVGSPTHFVILFNFSNGLRLTDENVKKVLENIEKFQERNPNHKIATTFGLVIHPHEALEKPRKHGESLPLAHSQGKQFERLDYRILVEMLVKHDKNNLVSGVRFGSEDTCYMYGEHRNDVFFAKEMQQIFKDHGLGIITDTLQARKIFNLPERNVQLDKLMATFGQDYHRSLDVIAAQSRLFATGFRYDGTGNAASVAEQAISNGSIAYAKYIKDQFAKYSKITLDELPQKAASNLEYIHD